MAVSTLYYAGQSFRISDDDWAKLDAELSVMDSGTSVPKAFTVTVQSGGRLSLLLSPNIAIALEQRDAVEPFMMEVDMD
ncbi:hypothetical protein [Nocardia vermiculata]|uniref:Uncharacterized protein n=1 Tax=Nocardia vermiculata TaxID=257274 RepID=A0A846XR85_9NOCA|nr:hypothetical protein [Nocardia vermiculata]NKY49593.1 hypothetical protein [Nocardia vermiculata]